LTKGQQVMSLTPKAFDTLVVLLRHSGRVVEKDELLKEIWPDTFVEEGILAVNVAAIRKALSEGEEGRSYIETVPRRGYRFVGEVRQTAKASEDRAAAGEPPEIKRSGIVPWGLAAGLLVLAGVAIGWYVSRSRLSSIPPPSQPIPLTSYPGTELSPTFSPDGSQVAFSWDGEHQDNFDIYVKQVVRADAVRLTRDPARDMSPAWSPDGRYIAFAREGAVFLIPPTGGAERKVADIRAGDIEWTKDSKSLVVCAGTFRQSRILSLALDTGEAKELTFPPRRQDITYGDFNVALSPDGLKLAFVRLHTSASSDLYLMPLTGGEPRQLTPDGGWIRGITWTADGREVVYASRASLSQCSMEAQSNVSSKRVEGVDPAGAVGPIISRSALGHVRLAYERIVLETNIWVKKVPRNRPHRRAN
jgi:DNA-binding winged helix-turn-helix (wHTH) protein/dipeptidyl aminopeptidase/acylaminoacyl peptidase